MTTAGRQPRERSERRAFWALADSWTITLGSTRQPSSGGPATNR